MTICSRKSPAGGIGFELEEVTVAFPGKAALEDVSLTLEPGSTVALIGPSGAGKTTLLRLLAGALEPTGGALRDMGGVTRAQRAAATGFIHQDHALVPVLRVLQNVLAGRLGRYGALRGLRSVYFPSRADVEAVHAALLRVGIGELLYRRTDRLSGGEQQRVAIARALFQEPCLLLCDEPVASLDPARSRDVIQLLIDLAEERGATLVTSVHDERLAGRYFDRVIGLREGRIVLDSSRSESGQHEALTPAALEDLYGIVRGDS
ncbi:Phosphate-import ATP-binding protein PhnC [Planctomycetes bacterium Poly30]|uniref:Phosphate-import ATP-binding protein PhnC n=1 Tax=Saltatorellus ferox TaxID=2528018 RepID=A0A518ETX0_9BACT|nr:Phosphate-import ATP-binding protein PhnC [Planctomycetes bacterium Poly30]